MSKITFIYTHHEGFDETRVEVTCTGVHISNAVESFKTFLLHVGHHPENVERIVFFEKEDRQALPQQLDMFSDSHE